MIFTSRTIALTLSLLLMPFQLLLAQQWTQIGSDIDGEEAFDNSGHALSMNESGSSIIIGAPGNSGSFSSDGHARVYELNADFWQQKGIDIDGEAEYDGSGISVAMNSDGNIIAIGAVSNSDGGSGSGHVRVYEWNGADWLQKGADIDGTAAYSESGNAIDLSSDGNILIVGASKQDEAESNAGQVRVHEWDGVDWTQKGPSINGDAANDGFGYSVSISSDGNTIGVGAPLNSGINVNGGQVKLFEWDAPNWVQKGSALFGEANSDRFGFSLSLSSDGNTAAIGAIMNDNIGADAGHVRVFEWNSTAWEQKGNDIDGEAYGDNSGWSVSISADGNTLAVGARGNEGISGTNAVAGHVRVFLWYENAWAQIGNDIDGEGGSDFSGQSIALSSEADALAVGAHWNNGNGSSAGHVRVWSAPEFVGVSESTRTQDIRLYPNPMQDSFFIDLQEVQHDIEIRVKNSFGQLISSTYFSVIQTTEIDLHEASGVYYVEVKSNALHHAVFRLIKQ